MIRSGEEDLVMVSSAEVSKEAVSEVRVTVFESDPSVEGSTVPVQDMAAETSSVVGRIRFSCMIAQIYRF